ncbi:hypothetical protein [Streptomyces cacaoi]|uniref:hypothetical protein n=1 Tax=Streptomyces cacaoi TaxID=1898 RepID=UPI00261A9910|nr:hypothetical protein [Streptomyces cacaoi]
MLTGHDYWSEAVATVPLGRTYWLGSTSARTPRLALRWLHARARDIADQLDPPAARPVRHWIHDDQEHERALRHLANGQLYAFTAIEDDTRYVLTARPIHGAYAQRHMP